MRKILALLMLAGFLGCSSGAYRSSNRVDQYLMVDNKSVESVEVFAAQSLSDGGFKLGEKVSPISEGRVVVSARLLDSGFKVKVCDLAKRICRISDANLQSDPRGYQVVHITAHRPFSITLN